jgi:(4-(4-[2-(gamma-L-glutamylamino)ethyl]phenoxymethyl)furan-2-yl)methanamine synthase
MSWIGLDIGGANLKASDGRGWARSVPFPLWREHLQLHIGLTDLLREAPPAKYIAVTMTGELCDCFRTKAAGVWHILSAVEQACGRREVLVYLVSGRLVSVEDARQTPELAAASNWHVLARFVGRFVDSHAAVLVDIGSTTSDIIPLLNGEPHSTGCTDTDRLLAGELVYTGVGRTPICAVTDSLPWRGRQCPVAAELFATTADAYVLLGDVPEGPGCDSTADGRPLTREFARERLARMICADATTFTYDDAVVAAGHIRDVQLTQLARSAKQALVAMPNPMTVFCSGAGEFLARSLCGNVWPAARVVSLTERIGKEASRSAPAHALAVLASEMAATRNYPAGLL